MDPKKLTNTQWKRVRELLFAARRGEATELLQWLGGISADESQKLLKDYEEELRENAPEKFMKEMLGSGPMHVHQIDEKIRIARGAPRRYVGFIRVPALSVGVYRVAAGVKDEQKPHTEDEVYYVVEGRAKFWCAGEVREVGPGSILFVERGVDHRFIDIFEELVVLVVFGPAEGSLTTDGH